MWFITVMIRSAPKARLMSLRFLLRTFTCGVHLPKFILVDEQPSAQPDEQEKKTNHKNKGNHGHKHGVSSLDLGVLCERVG